MKKLRYTFGPTDETHIICSDLGELLVCVQGELSDSPEDDETVWQIGTVMMSDDEMVDLPEFEGW